MATATTTEAEPEAAAEPAAKPTTALEAADVLAQRVEDVMDSLSKANRAHVMESLLVYYKLAR